MSVWITAHCVHANLEALVVINTSWKTVTSAGEERRPKRKRDVLFYNNLNSYARCDLCSYLFNFLHCLKFISYSFFVSSSLISSLSLFSDKLLLTHTTVTRQLHDFNIFSSLFETPAKEIEEEEEEEKTAYKTAEMVNMHEKCHKLYQNVCVCLFL